MVYCEVVSGERMGVTTHGGATTDVVAGAASPSSVQSADHQVTRLLGAPVPNPTLVLPKVIPAAPSANYTAGGSAAPALPSIMNITRTNGSVTADGLYAYGVGTTVVVVDIGSMQVVASLQGHISEVSATCWVCSTNGPASAASGATSSPSALGSPHRRWLLSADASGLIIAWDVASGHAVRMFHDSWGNKFVSSLGGRNANSSTALPLPSTSNLGASVIVDLKTFDANGYYFMSLSGSGALILWSLYDEEEVPRRWKASLPAGCSHFTLCQPMSVSLSHNESERKLVASVSPSGWIVFLRDVGPNNPPAVVEQRWRINVDSQTSNMSVSSPVGSTSSWSSQNFGSSSQNESGSGSAVTTVVESLFCPWNPSILLIVLVQEILFLDTRIGQPISKVETHRIRSPVSRLLLSADDPHRLFTVHKDCSLSTFVLKQQLSADKKAINSGSMAAPTQQFPMSTFKYQWLENTDLAHSYRRPKKAHPLYACAMFTGDLGVHSLLVSTSDGRVWRWDYRGESVRFSTIQPSQSSGGQRTVMTGSSVKNQRLQNPFWLLTNILDMCCGISTAVASRGDTLLLLGTAQGTVHLVDSSCWKPLRLVELSTTQPIRHVAFCGSDRAVVCSPKDVWLLDLNTGRILATLASTTSSSLVNREPRLSLPSLDEEGSHCLVLFKNAPAELWDVQNVRLVRLVGTQPLSSAAWNPAPSRRTHFVYTFSDGVLRFSSTDSLHGADIRKPAPFAYGTILCVAWNESVLVGGDGNGVLWVWHVRLKKSRHINTNRSVGVRKIILQSHVSGPAAANAGKKNDSTICLVHFADGNVAIFNLEHGSRLADSSIPAGSFQDVAWVQQSVACCISERGDILLCKNNLDSCNSPYHPTKHLLPISSPFFLSPNEQQKLRCQMLFPSNASVSFLDDDPEALLSRCLSTAKHFGDVRLIKFWRVVEAALHEDPLLGLPLKNPEGSTSEEEPDVLFRGGSGASADSTSSSSATSSASAVLEPLDQSFGLLRSPSSVRKQLEEEVDLEDPIVKSVGKPELLRWMGRQQLQLGRREAAASTLLSTPPEHPDFLANSLTSVIIASTYSKDQMVHMAKLVAGNLITNGNIDRGVDLLCAVGRVMDACNCLQMYDKWEEAALLAKTSLLCKEDILTVHRKWAAHVSNAEHDLLGAVQVLVSVGDFESALQLLFTTSNPHWVEITAALFALLKTSKHPGLLSSALLQKESQLATQLGSVFHQINWWDRAIEIWKSHGGENGLVLAQNLQTEWQRRQEEYKQAMLMEMTMGAGTLASASSGLSAPGTAANAADDGFLDLVAVAPAVSGSASGAMATSSSGASQSRVVPPVEVGEGIQVPDLGDEL